MSRIEQIQSRAQQATAGDWKAVAQGGSSTIVAPVLPPRNDRRSEVPYGYEESKGYCIGYPFLYQSRPDDAAEETRMDFVCFSHADAKFIAHSRSDIPWLLAEIDRLTADAAVAHEQYLSGTQDNIIYAAGMREDRDIALQDVAILTARIEALHLMQELGEDLAWRSYLGIQVLQTVLKKSKLEAGADVSTKLLTDIAIQYPHFPAKSALRPMPARRELENKP